MMTAYVQVGSSNTPAPWPCLHSTVTAVDDAVTTTAGGFAEAVKITCLIDYGIQFGTNDPGDELGRLQRDAVMPDGRKYHDVVRVAPAQAAFRRTSNRSGPNGREVSLGQIQRRVEDRFAVGAGLVTQVPAHAPGHRQHPLAVLDARQDLIDQVGRDLGQAAGRAGGAQVAALAGERDHEVVLAVGAGDAGKSVSQDAALQVLAKASTSPASPYRPPSTDAGFSMTKRSSRSPSSAIAVQVRDPGA